MMAVHYLTFICVWRSTDSSVAGSGFLCCWVTTMAERLWQATGTPAGPTAHGNSALTDILLLSAVWVVGSVFANRNALVLGRILDQQGVGNSTLLLQ